MKGKIKKRKRRVYSYDYLVKLLNDYFAVDFVDLNVNISRNITFTELFRFFEKNNNFYESVIHNDVFLRHLSHSIERYEFFLDNLVNLKDQSKNSNLLERNKHLLDLGSACIEYFNMLDKELVRLGNPDHSLRALLGTINLLLTNTTNNTSRVNTGTNIDKSNHNINELFNKFFYFIDLDELKTKFFKNQNNTGRKLSEQDLIIYNELPNKTIFMYSNKQDEGINNFEFNNKYVGKDHPHSPKLRIWNFGQKTNFIILAKNREIEFFELGLASKTNLLFINYPNSRNSLIVKLLNQEKNEIAIVNIESNNSVSEVKIKVLNQGNAFVLVNSINEKHASKADIHIDNFYLENSNLDVFLPALTTVSKNAITKHSLIHRTFDNKTIFHLTNQGISIELAKKLILEGFLGMNRELIELFF